VSRKSFPKQFVPLAGQGTLFQAAAGRMLGAPDVASPLVITNSDFRFIVAEQLAAEGIIPSAIMIEPAAKNTGPAILAAAAKEAGGITLIETDGQNSSTKQTGDVEAAIIQGVDGIIISPIDAVAMAPALQGAVDAGIPVVTIDRRVDGVEGILSHV